METIYTIILNFNNYADTCECIDSIFDLPESRELKNVIVLVDNASSDGSGEKLRERYASKVVFLESSQNIGYAAGNNLGIRYALEQNPEYICILNNDTIVEEDFYTDCVRVLKQEADCGFVSPVIMDYKTGKVQSTGGDIILKKGTVTAKNSGMDREALTGLIESDYMGGACLVFRTELIQTIGLIPENYFLFFEETEWCWKAKKTGYVNRCTTATAIRHKGSASIDTISGLHAYLMERNRVVFLRRNAPNRAVFWGALAFLGLKYTKNAITKDKAYLAYLGYMYDGLRNRVDHKKYPFIVIRES